jgi:hypothetical protein
MEPPAAPALPRPMPRWVNELDEWYSLPPPPPPSSSLSRVEAERRRGFMPYVDGGTTVALVAASMVSKGANQGEAVVSRIWERPTKMESSSTARPTKKWAIMVRTSNVGYHLQHAMGLTTSRADQDKDGGMHAMPLMILMPLCHGALACCLRYGSPPARPLLLHNSYIQSIYWISCLVFWRE